MATKSQTVQQPVTTPTWQIAALWALVTVPAAWGFIETLMKAVTLFTG